MSRFPSAVRDLAEPLSSPAAERARIAIRSGAMTFVVDPNEVERLESAGAYVRIHERLRSFLVRGSLSTVMERLGMSRFARVHRSTAVAITAIVELRRSRSGELRVVLASGTTVTSTRMTREELERLAELG
jgi:two-component system, LytTR family, response regulator